jgi:hypothetical protein
MERLCGLLGTRVRVSTTSAVPQTCLLPGTLSHKLTKYDWTHMGLHFQADNIHSHYGDRYLKLTVII